MRWDVFCDHGARRYDRALTYVHTIEDNRSGTDPCIIVYPDPLGRNPLFDNRTRWILVNVIYRHDLDERRSINIIADGNSALTAEDIEFANQAMPAYLDSRMRQATKVIDVELRVIHHKGVFTNHDPLRKGMEIYPFVEVNPAPQLNPVGVSQAHIRLNGDQAVHLEYKSIRDSAEGNSDDGGNTAQEPLKDLFEYITSRTAGLASKIKKALVQRRFVAPVTRRSRARSAVLAVQRARIAGVI